MILSDDRGAFYFDRLMYYQPVSKQNQMDVFRKHRTAAVTLKTVSSTVITMAGRK